MRIIDAHQHFWDIDANYLPWLRDRPVDFRYGDYTALKRNYLPADYRKDASGFDVAGTVYVEAEWDPDDPLGEVAWVERLKSAERLPTVMVAQAWLDRDGVDEVLAAHGRSPLVRGVRHKPRAAAGPDAIERGAPGSMGDARWRQGFALLAPNGLSFDLQAPWWHLPEALELATQFPGTQIVVNHTGLPARRSEQGLAGWRSAMAQLAQAPNVAVKISGIGIAGRPWNKDDNRRVVLETIDLFGTDRCMMASNFPVDGLTGGFGTIYRGFLDIIAGCDVSEKDAMLYGNANRIYRMGLGR